MKNETKLHLQCIRSLKSYNIPYINTLETTSVSGTADIIICLEGMYIEVEIKTSAGVLSTAQNERARQVQSFKGKFYVVRCYEEFEMLMQGKLQEYVAKDCEVVAPF